MSLASHIIVGFGAVGRALAHDLRACDEEIVSIVTSQPELALKEIPELAESDVSDSVQFRTSEFPLFIWLTVPDDFIKPKLEEVLNSSPKPFPSDTTFIHCSGSLGLDVLEQAKERGYRIASLHPLQTFSKDVHEDNSSAFKGIYASVLARDETTKERLNHLCNLLGITSLHVTEREKKQIHLSATIACNYLTTLLDIAQRQLPESGDFSINIFEPLLRKTIEQNLRNGAAHALSGPVKRGDVSTIKTHLELLNKSDVTIYKLLGEKTLHLVSEKSEGHQNLQKILENGE